MSLLTNLLNHSLDAGYAQAARRRRRQAALPGPPDPETGAAGGAATLRRRLGRARLPLSAGVVVIALLLTTAALQTTRSAPALAQQRKDLVARIRSQTAAADKLQRDVVKLRERVAAESASGDPESDLTDHYTQLSLAAGTVAVRGPGVRVTVDDAHSAGDASGDPRSAGGADLSRVQDGDLQRLVNGLWLAGAENIAVNGERLTALSAIRTAGQAILVDFKPLAPPYVVEAVGDPKTLAARFLQGPGGDWFNALKAKWKIRFDITQQDRLDLPAAPPIALRYAGIAGTAAPSAGPSASPHPTPSERALGQPRATPPGRRR